MHRNDRYRGACAEKGLRITEQRKIIARSFAKRGSSRRRGAARARRRGRSATSRSPPSTAPSGCSRRRGSSSGTISATAARATRRRETHHDHLIDVETGNVIEFVDEELEALQRRIAEKLGFASSITGWSFTASRSAATTRPRPDMLAPLRMALRVGMRWSLVPALPSASFCFGSWSGGRRPGRGSSCGAAARRRRRGARRGRSRWPHTLFVANHVSWLDILVTRRRDRRRLRVEGRCRARR